MTAVAIRREDPVAVVPAPQSGPDFGALMDFARELVPTGFLPDHIKKPAQAVAIILAGRELGMEPMLALRSISMVKGKIVVAADAQLALFKSKGGRAQFERLDDTIAILHLIHPNGDTHTETFSIEDAKRAGLLNNANWKNFPKAMLRSRCITAGLKSVGFEPTSGAYDPDEAQHFSGVPSMTAPTGTTNGGATSQAASTAQYGNLKELTLAEAMTMTVSDNPAAFKGKGSELLSSYSTEHLQTLRAWLEDKLREGHRDDFAARVEAITLLLDDRERAQGKLPLDSEPVAEPVAVVEPAAPASSVRNDLAAVLEPNERPRALQDEQDDGLPF